MEFRSYDPTIGRFTGIDPVTHFSMSTYTAFDNSPIFFADPSGADAEAVGGDGLTNDQWMDCSRPGGDCRDAKKQNYLDKATSKALKETAGFYAKGIDLSKLSEEDKQGYFKKDELITIGILLYEFATGTGLETRNFDFGEHPFATSFMKGRILEEIVKEFTEKLQKQGYDFNSLGDTKTETITLEFSPDIGGWNPESWKESYRKHKDSNPSQFFVGGASARVSIKDQNLIIQVYNSTSRKSLYLHLPFVENYKRTPGKKNKILSTIKQNINATFKLEKQ